MPERSADLKRLLACVADQYLPMPDFSPTGS
jgi:hypothetical protein